jgi:hypothetical protein
LDKDPTTSTYVECNDLIKHVIFIMAKAMAEEFGFKYLYEDLKTGLHNLAHLMAPDFTFREIPDGIDSSNNASTGVLQCFPSFPPPAPWDTSTRPLAANSTKPRQRLLSKHATMESSRSQT